jgi:hypothetical protein
VRGFAGACRFVYNKALALNNEQRLIASLWRFRRFFGDYERAVVVEAEVKEEQRRPLIGVNGAMCSKRI